MYCVRDAWGFVMELGAVENREKPSNWTVTENESRGRNETPYVVDVLDHIPGCFLSDQSEKK